MRKTKLCRKLILAVIGVSIFFAGVNQAKVVLKAKAAEMPVVTDLLVAASTDGMGVVATCSYQNYTDQSGCEMRLYLYKIESSGVVIETQKLLSCAEQGSGSTEPMQVEEGVYRASVTMDFGMEMKQINSQNYFNVTKVDGNYKVVEEIENELPIQENPLREELCDHAGKYVIEQQATSVRDALQAYKCVKCGAILKYVEVPNSAYAAFLNETADLIKESLPGEVIISTNLWMSFNRDVFEAMQSRPDVTVVVNYQYQGEPYSLTIPAGTDVEMLMDENGYGGFRYIENILLMMNA